MILMAERTTSKTTGNDKRLVVYVSQEMFEKLENLAEKEDRSISNFTRNLISQALDNLEKNKLTVKRMTENSNQSTRLDRIKYFYAN